MNELIQITMGGHVSPIVKTERVFAFRAWHMPTRQMRPIASFNEDFVYLAWNPKLSDSENYKAVDNPFDRADCIILQFTGVCDYFGNKIWEGDIIRWTHYDEAEAVYNEYYYEVAFRNGGFGTLDKDEDFTPYERIESGDVVSGNVFEHSYLLTQSLCLQW